MNSNGGTADAQAPMENKSVSHGKPSFKDVIFQKEKELDDIQFSEFLGRKMKRAKVLLQKAATGENLGRDTEESRQKVLDAIFADGAVGNGGDPGDFVTKSRYNDRKGYKKLEAAQRAKIIAEDTRGDTWANGTTRRKKPKWIYVVNDDEVENPQSTAPPHTDEDAELTDPIYKGMNAALYEIAGFLVRYGEANDRASVTLKKFEKLTDEKKQSLNKKEENDIMKKKNIRKYYGQLKTLIEAIQSWMVDFEAHAYDNREPVIVSIEDIHPISLVPNYELIRVKINNLDADWAMLKVDSTPEHVVCMLKYENDEGETFGLDDLEDSEHDYLKSLGPKFEIFNSDKTDFMGSVELVRFAMDDQLFDFLPYSEPETSTALKQDPTFKLKENGDGMDDSLDGAAGKEVEPEEEEESSSESESEASESGGEEFDSGSDNESSSGSEEDSDDETPVRKRKPAASAKPAAPAAAIATAPAAMTTKNPFPLGSALWCLFTRLQNHMITEEQARNILENLKPERESEHEEDDVPLAHRQTTLSTARNLQGGASSKRDLQEGPSSKKPRNS